MPALEISNSNGSALEPFSISIDTNEITPGTIIGTPPGYDDVQILSVDGDSIVGKAAFSTFRLRPGSRTVKGNIELRLMSEPQRIINEMKRADPQRVRELEALLNQHARNIDETDTLSVAEICMLPPFGLCDMDLAFKWYSRCLGLPEGEKGYVASALRSGRASDAKAFAEGLPDGELRAGIETEIAKHLRLTDFEAGTRMLFDLWNDGAWQAAFELAFMLLPYYPGYYALDDTVPLNQETEPVFNQALMTMERYYAATANPDALAIGAYCDYRRRGAEAFKTDEWMSVSKGADKGHAWCLFYRGWARKLENDKPGAMADLKAAADKGHRLAMLDYAEMLAADGNDGEAKKYLGYAAAFKMTP